MSNLPLHIQKYLNDRGISDAVIAQTDIKWLNGKIVLPVYSQDGKFLFNKYRRSPDAPSTDPKYTYDFGATAALYNVNNVNLKSTVFITEGELDTLTLMSYGLNAVSSTGGCGTFNEEWAEVFKDTPEIYICYDNDVAGIKGMMRVNRVLPNAKVILFPSFKGKDITDFIKEKGFAAFVKLDEKARSWAVHEPDLNGNKSKQITDYNRLANEAMIFIRENPEYKLPVESIIENILYIRDGLKFKKKKLLKMDPPDSRLEEAKKISIEDYLNFNKAGYAHCVWHNEKTPSLKFYPEKNKVYCYGGCAKGGDVIDVVMAQNHCTLQEAINIILKT